MFAVNRYETGKILTRRASGIVRKYDAGCPHRVGDELVLTSKFLPAGSPNGRGVPFAKAQIVTIRPSTVRQFKEDPMIAEMDGYNNSSVWYEQMRVMYKGLRDTDQVYHLKLRFIEIDGDAGHAKSEERQDDF